MKISFVKNKKNKKFNYSPRFQAKKNESTEKKIIFKKKISTNINKINKSQLLLLVGLLFLFLYLLLN